MAEVGDEELAEVALVRTSLLLEDARGAILAVRDVEVDGAPSRWRQWLISASRLGERRRRVMKVMPGGIEPVEPLRRW